jgi:hypothetical protein
MNLREVSPYFSSKEFDPELDRAYKIHSADSHLAALEVIFKMGVQHTLDQYGERLDRLYENHDVLLAKISGKEIDPELTKKVITQTLDMGKVFKQ